MFKRSSYLFILVCLIATVTQATQLVQLLDHVHEAQAYWSQVSQISRFFFWQQPLNAWLSKNRWKNKIKKHQIALAKQEKLLIIHLAEQAKGKKCSAINLRQHFLCLKKHGVPGHFVRHWTTYATTAAIVAIIGIYLAHFHKTYTLFVLAPNTPPLLPALQNNAPFLGHDYVHYKGQQYLQVKKEQEAVAHQFLNAQHVQYSIQTPDKRLSFYNEKGETYLWEFIYNHGIQPIKEIIKILRNEAPSKSPILATNPEENQRLFTEELNLLLQEASKNTKTSSIVTHYLQGRSLENLSFAEKNSLFTKLVLFIPEYGKTLITSILDELKLNIEQAPAIHAPLPNIFSFKTVNEIFVDVGIIRALRTAITQGLEKHSHTIGLIPQMIILRALQKELQASALIHEINMFADRARINLELSAMIPFALASYCGYFFLNFLYKAISHKSFKKLKKDLISFSLLLNKSRYISAEQQNQDIEQIGLSFYWLARLARYTQDIPIDQLSNYQEYLEQLQSTTFSSEQKLTIIECMFKNFDFLH